MANLRPRISGFTLLELLVSLALFSLILVALSGGVSFGTRGVQAVDRRSGLLDDLPPVEAAIRRLLVGARSIEGSHDRLRFVSRLPDAFERAGNFEMQLFTDEDRLMLSWRRAKRQYIEQPFGSESSDGDDDGSEGEAELMRGVTDLSFDYFIPGEQRAEWASSSLDAGVVPQLIRMQIDFSSRGERRWPELVVAPAVDTLLRPPAG
jgi:general secretion pathway protein J